MRTSGNNSKSAADDGRSTSATTEARVAIFWFFNDRLILDVTPLSEAEPYGTALTHPTSHIDHWERLQRKGKVPSDVPYEEPARGRIIFDGREGRFHLLADQCILGRRDIIKAILKATHLPPGKTAEGRDEHDRCFGCLFPADDEW